MKLVLDKKSAECMNCRSNNVLGISIKNNNFVIYFSLLKKSNLTILLSLIN
jgi:hypothetical protein